MPIAAVIGLSIKINAAETSSSEISFAISFGSLLGVTSVVNAMTTISIIPTITDKKAKEKRNTVK